MDKTCTKCGTTRPIEQFNRSGKYRRSECRQCTRSATRQYAAGNKPRRNERLRSWRKRNPERARAKDRRARFLTKYGLSLDDVASLQQRHGGLCWICRVQSGHCIDHDHKTGRVRGVLCRSCNTFLGRVEAHPGLLERMGSYVEATT